MEQQINYEEWFFQSDYDIDTAFNMLDLKAMISLYTPEHTTDFFEQTKKIQQWLKQQ